VGIACQRLDFPGTGCCGPAARQEVPFRRLRGGFATTKAHWLRPASEDSGSYGVRGGTCLWPVDRTTLALVSGPDAGLFRGQCLSAHGDTGPILDPQVPSTVQSLQG
jgi:hypothetical protein